MKLSIEKSLFILPNLFTLLSLCCGLLAILFVMEEEPLFNKAVVLIIIAMFLDGFDGRVARFTKTQTSFGLELDSLADIVSFGVAPSVFMYKWVLNGTGIRGIIIAYLFTAAGAIRLARFNVLSIKEQELGRKKPGKFIVGLPIPSAAGFLLSLYLAYISTGFHLFKNEKIISVTMVVLALFMVSPIRFRSFKDIRLTKKTAFIVFCGAVASIIMALYLKPGIILLWLLGIYISIAVIELVIQLGKKRWPPFPSEK